MFWVKNKSSQANRGSPSGGRRLGELPGRIPNNLMAGLPLQMEPQLYIQMKPPSAECCTQAVAALVLKCIYFCKQFPSSSVSMAQGVCSQDLISPFYQQACQDTGPKATCRVRIHLELKITVVRWQGHNKTWWACTEKRKASARVLRPKN